MEKDVALGKVGDVKLTIEGGQAVIALTAKESVLDGAVEVEASVIGRVGAVALVDMLFAEIEAKSPPGAVVLEEGAKQVIRAAVAALK